MKTKGKEIILEDNAKKAVNSVKKNTLVIAGPGAGKTELLAQKALYLFENDLCNYPSNILAISFKKDAAENIQERVNRRLSNKYGKRFVSKTFDSFAKLILDRFYMTLPKELKPTSNYEIATDDIKKDAYSKVFNNAFGRTNDIDEEISSLNLENIDKKSEEYAIWKNLLFGYKKSYLTFNMISYLTLYIFRHNKYVKHIIKTAFPFVFLDEFQDTTSVQYAILKEIFLESQVNITAVGDNKQQIMIWAGAKKEIFNDYITDFHADRILLYENHRSAQKIVTLEKRMYGLLDEQEQFNTVGTSDAEGEVLLFETETTAEEAEMIGTDILHKIKSGLEPSNIAILVKQKPKDYTGTLENWLYCHNVHARVEAEYQDNMSENITKMILQSILTAIDYIDGEKWKEYVENCSYVFGLDIENDKNLKILVNKINIFSNLLFKEIQQYHGNNTRYIKEILSKVVQFLGENNIQNSYPEYSNESYFNKVIETLNKLLVISFNNITNKNIIDRWFDTIEDYMGKNSISILTIHKSKGLEYDTVYFIGLEDSAFWNFKNNPETERKAFFVAISRAKNSLSFSYCKHRRTGKRFIQTTEQINEFYELFRESKVVEKRIRGKVV